jgi:predicted RNA-binding Zn ribbon-like protein
MTTGAEDWRYGFLFIGNHVSLDFVNTRMIVNGEFKDLLEDWPSAIRWFHAAGLLNKGQDARLAKRWKDDPDAAGFVQRLRVFREQLRSLLMALEGGRALPREPIRELNRLLQEHRTFAELLEEDDGLERRETFQIERPDDLFAPLARTTAEFLAEADPNRVRQCEKCILQFYDTSKNAARRWCSMQRCGNRAKVAAYAQRKRSARGSE